jgi:hypothetical protein
VHLPAVHTSGSGRSLRMRAAALMAPSLPFSISRVSYLQAGKTPVRHVDSCRLGIPMHAMMAHGVDASMYAVRSVLVWTQTKQGAAERSSECFPMVL